MVDYCGWIGAQLNVTGRKVASCFSHLSSTVSVLPTPSRRGGAGVREWCDATIIGQGSTMVPRAAEGDSGRVPATLPHAKTIRRPSWDWRIDALPLAWKGGERAGLTSLSTRAVAKFAFTIAGGGALPVRVCGRRGAGGSPRFPARRTGRIVESRPGVMMPVGPATRIYLAPEPPICARASRD